MLNTILFYSIIICAAILMWIFFYLDYQRYKRDKKFRSLEKYVNVSNSMARKS